MRRFRLPVRPLLARPLVILGTLAIVVFAVTEAYARGGGGGNFGGGGGGGFGGGGSGFGGGGGGGGGDGLIWLVYLAFRYPLIGIPLLIVVVFVSATGANKGHRANQGRVIRKGKTAAKRVSALEVEQTLRATDPHFDKSGFFGRVVVAFRKVQTAWCAHDLAAIRPFVSDGIHERFALQLQEEKDLGYRDHIEGLDVTNVQFADVVNEGRVQIVTVRVTARCVDYRVSVETGKFVSGSRQPETFSEYWSFLRRRGTKEKVNDKGLVDGYCGNCGAPIEMSQWSKCQSCSAFLRSGEHDWVLVEITQASEWRVHSPDTIRGVQEMRATDPGFSVQHLEDRASVMYWRTAMADRLGNTTPMRKMASDELCERWKRLIQGGVRDDGRRWYFGERGVGAVEVAGMVPETDGRDGAIVAVTWSGTFFSVDPNGRRKRERKSSIVTTLLHLERRANVLSDPGETVSSAHCANCGAADAGGETDACEYCGEVMNDGKRDWVLVDLAQRHTADGRAMLAKTRGLLVDTVGSSSDTGAGADADAETETDTPMSRPTAQGLLAWMIRTSLADGHLDDREEARLISLTQRAGLRRQELDDLLAAARRRELEAPPPHDIGEARRWIDEAAAVALADGQVKQGEQAVLIDLGAQVGLSAADVRMSIAQTRQRLVREARAALRAEKQM